MREIIAGVVRRVNIRKYLLGKKGFQRGKQGVTESRDIQEEMILISNLVEGDTSGLFLRLISTAGAGIDHAHLHLIQELVMRCPVISMLFLAYFIGV